MGIKGPRYGPFRPRISFAKEENWAKSKGHGPMTGGRLECFSVPSTTIYQLRNLGYGVIDIDPFIF